MTCTALEQRNACDVCGAPVEGLGAACTAANGCAGTTTCSADGLSKVCGAVEERTACGLCGGPAIVGTVNDACVGASGCNGSLVCNELASALVCNAPAKNACNVCGGAAVNGVGDACTSAEGCEGQLTCNGDGSGTVCMALTKNACGVCGGPPVMGLGDACTTAANLPGTLECGAGGAAVCTVPRVLISEFSGGTTNSATDGFVELYNPTSTETSIGGWVLQYKSATGTAYSTARSQPGLASAKRWCWSN